MYDFQPDEEQALIIETVRGFAENEIRNAAREADESGQLPQKVLDATHELGLVANALPEEHGGGGARSAVTGALIAEELAWGDLAIALGALSPSLLALPVAEFGSDAQKSEILPRFGGASFAPGSLAVSEPRHDSDPFRPRTTAKRDGDAYVLSGAKTLVPWLEGTDSVLVSADDGGQAQAFLVPADADGLGVEKAHFMGIRGLPSVDLTLADVRVPASARLGGEAGCDVGRLVDWGRVALSAMAVGVARAAFEVSRDYAKEREAFGAPIGTKQAIAFKLADMAIEIDGARLLCWEAAWRLDQGLDVRREAALAYDQARRISLTVTDGAVQVLGGHGYIRDYLPEMHLRNASGFACFEALSLV
jgi:acyl-CoA dehydrogenase